jgi:YD repeat-containing protein
MLLPSAVNRFSMVFMPREFKTLIRVLMILLFLASGFSAAPATTIAYAYDAQGRVIAVTYPNGLTTNYVYDAAGNRTQVATAAPPVAAPVTLGVAVNTSANPVALSISGAYTSVSVVTGAAHGVATASGGAITYTPTSGYSGPDSFTYKATSASGSSSPATVLVAVAPAASPVGVTVAYGSSLNPVPLSVTGAYAGVALAALPTHGVATPGGMTISYTPAAGYFGSDSFQYTASNAVAVSNAALVTVTVNPAPPIANPVTASVMSNTSGDNISLNITGGSPSAVAVVAAPANGTATASGITIAYTPSPGYVGPDSFTYDASNAGGTSAAASAQITVTGLSAVAAAPYNCPTVGPTYVCATTKTSSYTFTGLAATLTITGGSGSYTYLWSTSGIAGGTWTTGQTTASITPVVTGVPAQNSGAAYYSCTVTDTVTGKQATSNAVLYSYLNNNGQ